MKPTYIKPMWLSALCVGAMLGACSNDAEQAPAIGSADEAPGRIEFTISLPGGSGVLYPTRTIQTDLECQISRLDVFEFRDKRDDEGNPVMWTLDDGTQVRAKKFVAYHSTDKNDSENVIDLKTTAIPNQYTFSINKEEGSGTDKHYFFFVANQDQSGIDGMIGFKTLAEEGFGDETYGDGQTEKFFLKTAGTTGWESTPGCFDIDELVPLQSADFYSSNDKLDKGYGMRMSGVATEHSHGDIDTDTGITIPDNGSVQCFVEMTRVAARVDLYSNAPNLVITDATMHYTYPGGMYFSFAQPKIDWERFVGGANWDAYSYSLCDVMLNDDATVTDRLYADDKVFADVQAIQQWKEVYDVEHGVQRAFYCYETPNRLAYENAPEYISYVEVKFQLEDGTTGHVDVPFTKTAEDGTVTGVDIVRNNLYRVVIGDGKRIVPGAEIKVSIKDVPWEVVDLPAIVD